MFLRSQVRKKDGKEHTDWSVVENKRLHDGRTVILTRHTQPEKELQLLLEQLNLTLPAQPPPKITASQVPSTTM